jgi:hypothetical protein
MNAATANRPCGETPASRRLLGWLPLGAALALACWPLAAGVPRGHDWRHELVRVAEFGAALREGQWPPAWAGNLYGGFGSPIFVYYAPLFAATASLFAGALGGVAAGVVAALATMTALRGVAAAALAAEAVRLAAGDAELRGTTVRIAAAGFLLHPYLIADLAVRNAFAELSGLAFLPLALAGALRAGRRPRQAAVLLAAGLAATLVAHNLTGLVALAMTGAAVLTWAALGAGRGAAALVLGTALGLLLAAWFWAPATALGPWMRPDELLAGKFDFRGNFPSLRELVSPSSDFAAGPMSALGLALGGVALRGARGRLRGLLAALLAASLGLLFLMSAASRPLWESVPLLRFLQFPWRLVGPLALLGSLVTALALAHFLRGRPARVRRAVEAATLLLLAGSALPALWRTRPLPPEVRRHLDGALRGDSLRAAGERATVGDEYLPRPADPRIWRRPAGGPVLALDPPAPVEVRVDAGSRLLLEIGSPAGGVLTLARWAFPGWSATADRRPLPLGAGPGGVLVASVPPGARRIELRFGQPPWRAPAIAVSAAAGILWLALAWRAWGRPAG